MPSWKQLVDGAPAVAADAQGFLEVGKHLTLATLRRDGAPRISGIEVQIRDGELWFGSMWQSPKARDLQADPRFALHSASLSPPEWVGDAKVSGRAVEIQDETEKARTIEAAGGGPPGPFHLFRAELDEVVIVRVGTPEDHLAVTRWTPAGGTKVHILR